MKKGSKASFETRQRMSQSHKGKKQTPEWIEKKAAAVRGKPRPSVAGENNPMFGKKRTEEERKRIGKGRIGIKLPPRSPEHRKKLSIALRGEKSSFWKGGIAPINKTIRSSSAYKEWRKSVFERDNWTCRECGLRGGILNADHIKPFSIYPELRFSVENGRTLCIACHKLTPTYARPNLTRD